MKTTVSRPRPPVIRWLVVGAVVFGAWLATGAELGGAQTGGGLERAWALVRAMTRPELSSETLAQGLKLSVQTLAVAAWGTAVGAVAGFVLALGASRNIAHPPRCTPSWGGRARVESVRVLLDGLRAIPDFAWALVVLVFIGPGPVTGAIAIAISVAGLLGKTYSQLLDAVPRSQVQAPEATGASRLLVGLWGYVPAAGGSMLSYTLLRFECSVRNASVIGIVGGGGLGAAIFEELGFGRYDRLSTLLLFLLGLTALSDRTSKWVLAIRKPQGHRGRSVPLFGLGLVLLVAGAVLSADVQRGLVELARLDTAFLRASLEGMFAKAELLRHPLGLLRDSLVPVGIAVVSTAIATAAGVAMLFAMPRIGVGVPPVFVRAVGAAAVRLADAVALLTRAIPDVVWLLLYGVALGLGPLAAVVAIATHSFGILARLFTEVVDDVPRSLIEARLFGSSRSVFLWGVWPEIAPRLWTHVALMVESNIRAGLIVGIVGAGGLGDAFHSSIAFWRFGDAFVQALAMIAVTVLVDRIARRITRPRGETGW